MTIGTFVICIYLYVSTKSRCPRSHHLDLRLSHLLSLRTGTSTVCCYLQHGLMALTMEITTPANGLVIRPVTTSMFEEIHEFLEDHFFPDAPLSASLGLSQRTQFWTWAWVRSCLMEEESMAALDPDTEKVIGVIIGKTTYYLVSEKLFFFRITIDIHFRTCPCLNELLISSSVGAGRSGSESSSGACAGGCAGCYPSTMLTPPRESSLTSSRDSDMRSSK